PDVYVLARPARPHVAVGALLRLLDARRVGDRLLVDGGRERCGRGGRRRGSGRRGGRGRRGRRSRSRRLRALAAAGEKCRGQRERDGERGRTKKTIERGHGETSELHLTTSGWRRTRTGCRTARIRCG